MNKTLKAVLIAINSIMLLLAIYWYIKTSEIEPIIVFLGQIASISILVFEDKIAKTSIKKISNSTVDIETSTEDTSNIKIKDVKKNSDIRIKRNK